jgi:hypothetical protein
MINVKLVPTRSSSSLTENVLLQGQFTRLILLSGAISKFHGKRISLRFYSAHFFYFILMQSKVKLRSRLLRRSILNYGQILKYGITLHCKVRL